MFGLLDTAYGLFQTGHTFVYFLDGDVQGRHEAEGVGFDHVEEDAGCVGVGEDIGGDVIVEFEGR